MMTEHDDPTLDRLKHHFAQRVINQARQVLEVWQRLTRAEWNSDGMEELADATLRLQRYAERFEQAEHAQLAGAIDRTLDVVEANRGRLSSESISELNQLMQRLSRTGLRHGDQLEHTVLPPLRKPVYLALKDRERAERLAQQLEFFGLQALSCETADAFRASMRERYPAAIVMEVDFAGPDMGLRLASEAQAGLEHKLPVLFFSDSETDTPTRLAAARAGGQEFFTGTLDASSVLEKIETLSRLSFYEPYRVLIVDDSRAQALHTEMVLNSAGIITRALTEPLSVMAELSDFQPDLIILDMYMPECLGTELAKVIRQHERHVSVPIIYLSAEDDLDKQLDAMSEGGDDFLTKPIRPRHLIATVRTRARLRARRDGRPLSFAMLDIDHFKQVNDRFGHPMGDRVIKGLALFLKQRLRKTDHIGRYGGEEFAVVLPDTDLDAARLVLDEIRQRFAEIHYPAQPTDLRCTFSCGIAELTPDLDIKSMAKQADEALYRAKHGGRNRIEVYRPDAR
ncbi:TPA: diguanylate cyclase GcbA [Pseudomonas aeruginosa]